MKSIKLLVSAALVLSTTPALVSPAYAAPASSETETRMANACAALVDATAKLHDGSPVWSTDVIDVTESEQTPVVTDTEVPGTRAGAGTPIYSGFSIAQGTSGADKPYRIGGSVNMFGDQVASTKTFPGSTFKFDRTTSTTTNYTFSCQLTQATEVYHPAVDIAGHPVEGFYTNNGTHPSGGEGSCQGLSPANPHWGEDIGNCIFTKTGDAVDPVHEDAYYTPGDDIVTTVGPKAESQTDIVNEYGLDGTDNTPWVQPGGPWFIGQVVICISPKKLPGTWTKQNGYTGVNCTTTWFNQAPWGGGSQTSNGTYISVPGV